MSWMAGLRRSAKARIAFATLGIFLLALWALGYYVCHMLRRDMQRQLSEQQFSTVSLIAAQLNRELAGRLGALEGVAQQAGRVMHDGPQAMQSFIEQRLALQALFNAGIYATGADGTAIADFPWPVVERVGVNYLDRDYIATALRQGKPVIGGPVIGKRASAPVFVMTAPIRDARGRVIGALAGATSLDGPNFLEEITAGRYGQSGGYLLIATPRRQIVTASDRRWIMDVLPPAGKVPALDRFLDGDERSAVVVNPLGVEELVSAGAIPVAGWSLLATLPTAEAFSPIREMQWRMLLAALLLTLLAGGLTAWVVHHQLALLAHREGALRDSEERFRVFHDVSAAGILIHAQGIILDCNQGLAQMSGYTVDELIGVEGLRLIAPDWQDLVVRQVRAGAVRPYDAVGRRRDGTLYQLSVRGCNIPYKGRVVRATELIDITERKRDEAKLQLAASVFTHTREGILITDAQGAIIDVNDSFTRLTGYRRDEMIGCNPRMLGSGQQEEAFYTALWRDLNSKGHWYGELWNRRKNGEAFAVMETISAVRNAQGQVEHYTALFSDITALKMQQRQLEHSAHYDALTSLPNRVLLADRLHQAMIQAARRGRQLAVVYLDLDRFKSVNDRHGHKTGDQLLVAAASAMKKALREGDTLSRLGGDEFVAVLPDLDDVAASLPILSRLLAAAAHPVTVGDLELQVSASLGVTFFPQVEEMGADQLLRQADQAMYQAKQSGKNRYHLFDAEQDRNVRGHHESLEHIRQALREREFVLHYQPKVNIRTGAVIGAEALIRWQHPERGLLPPAVFLPLIEDHPLAIDVGEWVIDSALAQMALWHAAGLRIPVSVNIGARQLQQSGFAQRLCQLLAAHPTLHPGDLELEVLETSALEDLTHVAQVIEECTAIGVRFSLDDFGTGYSSLTYLKRLAVGQIKIDKSFVHDMRDDPDDLAILEGILGLASAFQRQAIAEGVETVEHGTMLLQLGCELAQGYGIARPMPAADLQGWAATWRPDAAWRNLAPLHRDDLPLLFARVVHRAWVIALEAHFSDEQSAPPVLDAHRSRFGLWLNTEGQARYGDRADFAVVKSLHRQVHALAQTLCESRQPGQTPPALAELHLLRDALLDGLQALAQDVRL